MESETIALTAGESLESDLQKNQDFINVSPFTEEQKQQLTPVGKICFELARAEYCGEPIAGSPRDISDSLTTKTDLGRQAVIKTIHDVIHENNNGEKYAQINTNNGKPRLELTEHGNNYLKEVISKTII